MKVAKIIGREIYDACGNPALECEITLENGVSVKASVPAGISRGKREAHELRDGGQRAMGKGLTKAIENIESIIAPLLIGKEPNVVNADLEMIELDATSDKSRLGANAMLAVSCALLRAQAMAENMEPYELIGYLCEYSAVTLPFAMFNCISGGAHAKNNVRIQEMMIMPVGTQNFRACFEAAVSFHYYLKELLEKNFSCVQISKEGALAADFKDDAQALEFLMEAINAVQKTNNCRFFIALDVAASQFYDKKTNKYDWNGKLCTSDDLINLYERLSKHYPIFSIEDGLSEHDEKGWVAMTAQLKEKVQIIGDDIFTSNPNYIAYGIEKGIGTGVVIKPNQIGTLTEALQSIKLCREYDLTCILSHRSCETNDPLIVDLAVGASTSYIKAGGVAGGEHVAKYNRLLRIEDSLMLSILES